MNASTFHISWPDVWALAPRIGGAFALAAVIYWALSWVHDRIARSLSNDAAAQHAVFRIAAAVVVRTPRISLAAGACAAAIAAFGLFAGWMRPVLVLMLAAQAGLWLSSFLDALLRFYARQRGTDNRNFANAYSLMRVMMETIIWSIVFVVVLSNFGIDVTAMIAGLGIGGIAIGLAAQGIFADLFGSLAIVFDKPFVQGDFIVFGDNSGTIENVGIKSTRIRALTGEQIVLSNSALLAMTIHNYQRLRERRIVFDFGITYQTPYAVVKQLSGLVRAVIESTAEARFERCHFKAFGDSALEFEIVYHVLSSSYARYMDVQQDINLELMRRFEELGVDFAYPTQTVFFAEESKERRAA